MSLLEVKDLEFCYDEKIPILKIPHFSVEGGETVFLFGPSGSGKTTFLEILSGVLVPQRGSVMVAGTDITRLNSSARDHFRGQKIGYIFQSFNLIPYLSVLENILLPSQLKKQLKKSTFDAAELKNITEVLEIDQLLNSRVTEISVGQQQRVAAARALLGAPDLILADEPTSALDFDARENFLKLLFELCRRKKTALIFVSHDRTLKGLFQKQVSLPEINRGAL
jgi:putative ABC transport system ATP-binding protein